MSILITTLGLSWGVIPEAYGLLAPDQYPLYQHHPDTLATIPLDVTAPDALWVVTTAPDPGREDPRHKLLHWWQTLAAPIPMRVFCADTVDTSADHAVRLLRELIFRCVLAAGPDAILALAGGRKTMSADLQHAGSIFGCRCLLHILPPEPPNVLKDLDFTAPLPPEIHIQPVFMPGHTRAVHLDFDPVINATAWPLPPDDRPWPAPDSWLSEAVRERQRQASHLLVSAHRDLAATEKMANWRGLYRLSPGRIHNLRQRPLTPADHALLQRLPKAELHCHIGGILDLTAQCQVGTAVWEQLPNERRQRALNHLQALNWDDPWQATTILRSLPQRAEVTAAALAHEGPEVWYRRLYIPTEPRFGLKGIDGEPGAHPHAFPAYELPGELSGSALLGEQLALRPYATAILAYARSQHLRYLELRCSPAKYRPHDPLSWLRDFHQALQDCHQDGDPVITYIIIADRRQQNECAAQVIATACAARHDMGNCIAGIDLAGDETSAEPAHFAQALEQAFATCLPITIHAGEGQTAEQIWQATYRLHADRIGHGLSLADNRDLARRFRDRRICLELCPSSNREVVGYHDPDHPHPDHPGHHRHYPLRDLLELGVPLTVCTDNPGISRTTLAEEYLAAARMTPGGLSWWETLGLIRQSFLHAFCDAETRDRLLVEADADICGEITEDTP